MLPTQQARREILSIHTKTWNPPVEPKLLAEVADLCVGYCGADIKSLATEAALRALRRRYPQIYDSSEKLLIDPAQITLTRADFLQAMRDITPAQARVAISNAAPLASFLRPLLARPLEEIIAAMQQMFPPLRHRRRQRDLAAATNSSVDVLIPTDKDDDEEDEDAIFQIGEITVQSFKFGSHAPLINRPRLLICGSDSNQGQPHVASAILHRFEEVPVFSLDFASLNADISAKTMEEACVHIITEARRKLPAVLFLPHLDSWYHAAHESLRLCLMNLLNDIPPSLPLFLLATADTTFDHLPQEASALFSDVASYQLNTPDSIARTQFFGHVAIDVCTPPEKPSRPPSYQLEVLPKAPVPVAPPPPPLSADEKKRREEQSDRHWLRELRMTLRDFIHRLLSERKYRVFEKPVDPEEVPDYYELIKKPMSLELMLQKVDCHRYKTLNSFVADIDLLVENAKQYNDPLNDPMRVISKANHLRDNIEHMLFDMDQEVFDRCDEIAARKRAEGDDKWDVSDAEASYQRNRIPKPRPPRPPALFDVPDDLQLGVAEHRKPRKKTEAARIDAVKCEMCRSAGHAARMLLCDGCDHGYHTFCLNPPLRHIPSGDWFCPECIRASAARRDRMTRQQKQMQSGDPEAATEEKQKAEKAAEEHAEQKKKSDNEMEEAKAKEPEKKSARKKALDEEVEEITPLKKTASETVAHTAESAKKRTRSSHSDSPLVSSSLHSLETPPKAAPPSPPDSRKKRKLVLDQEEKSATNESGKRKRKGDEKEKEKEKEKETSPTSPTKPNGKEKPKEKIPLSLTKEKSKEKLEKDKPPAKENKEKEKEKEKETDKVVEKEKEKSFSLLPPVSTSSSSASKSDKEKSASSSLPLPSSSSLPLPSSSLSATEKKASSEKSASASLPAASASSTAEKKEKQIVEPEKEKSNAPMDVDVNEPQALPLGGVVSPAPAVLPPAPPPRAPSPPPPPFVFDVSAARNVVSQLVSATEGCNVEELCAAHAKVQRVLFDHRNEYDRGNMIQALLEVVQSLKKC